MASIDYGKACRLLARRDPVMGGLIRTHGSCGLATAQKDDHFVALAQAVVNQQLSARAARTIYGRMLDLLPERRLTPDTLLSISPDLLRTAGLSRSKASYLVDLARAVQEARIELDALEALDDESVILELTKVKGIGRWSAEMFLMFRLHRPDVLPVGDQGIVRAMQRAYRLRKAPTADRMRKIAEPWRPYRSVACWYLWASLDNAPQA
jgi:DNA-3-methyladenine glycosylase II